MSVADILRTFYINHTNAINRSVIVLYIILIVFIYMNRIRGYKYAFIVLLSVTVVIVVGWYAGIHKLPSLRKESCIISKPGRESTQMNGLLYSGCFDFWHVSHVFMWMVVGQLVPHQYIPVILLSLGWEFTEHLQFKRDGSCISPICGRTEDLFLNMLGYVLGSFLSR